MCRAPFQAAFPFTHIDLTGTGHPLRTCVRRVATQPLLHTTHCSCGRATNFNSHDQDVDDATGAPRSRASGCRPQSCESRVAYMYRGEARMVPRSAVMSRKPIPYLECVCRVCSPLPTSLCVTHLQVLPPPTPNTPAKMSPTTQYRGVLRPLGHRIKREVEENKCNTYLLPASLSVKSREPLNNPLKDIHQVAAAPPSPRTTRIVGTPLIPGQRTPPEPSLLW